MRIFVERVENGQKVLTRLGFNDKLPSKTGVAMFVEGGHGRRNEDLRKLGGLDELYNFFVQFLGVLNGATFSFVCERKFEQKAVWWEGALFAPLKQIFVKASVVGMGCVGYYGVVRLETLNKDLTVLVPAVSAADYLVD